MPLSTYVYFENTPKVFYPTRRIRQKYLIIFGQGAKSLSQYMEITVILEGYYLYKIISEYVKNILACTENKLKEYKRIWRIHKGYFAVHVEKTPINIKSTKT
jgi:hypothetical protein